MEIAGLEHGGTPSYIPDITSCILRGTRLRDALQGDILSHTPTTDNTNIIYRGLPVAKTAQLLTAERVCYICHCCGKLIWLDESRKITTGRTEAEETPKITVEHSLCKRCKEDYAGLPPSLC